MNLVRKWYYINYMYPRHRKIAYSLGIILNSDKRELSDEYLKLKEDFIHLNKKAFSLNFIPFSFDEIIAPVGNKVSRPRTFKSLKEKKNWLREHSQEINQ